MCSFCKLLLYTDMCVHTACSVWSCSFNDAEEGENSTHVVSCEGNSGNYATHLYGEVKHCLLSVYLIIQTHPHLFHWMSAMQLLLRLQFVA